MLVQLFLYEHSYHDVLLLLETYWLPVQVASVTGGFLCYIDFPGTQIVTKQTLALEHVS